MSIDKSSYEWLFFKRQPSWLRRGPFAMGLYKEWVAEQDTAYPGFAERLRSLVLMILDTEEDAKYLRRALCALAVVGIEEDIPKIESLLAKEDEELATDVRTCVYAITHQR